MGAEQYAGGALVLTRRDTDESVLNTAELLRSCGIDDATVTKYGRLTLATWGNGVTARPNCSPTSPVRVVLSGSTLGPSGPVEPSLLNLADGRAGTVPIDQLLPPFAAIEVRGERADVATDFMGYRHLYYCQSPEHAAVSTSTAVLAALIVPQLDREGLAVQAMLGWQLGGRTLLRGVSKLRQNARVRLANGAMRSTDGNAPDRNGPPRPSLSEAVESSADLLRGLLDRYLDESSEVVLQLTGGLDSRILLAAIAPDRRRNVTALTLQTEPGSADVEIASALAMKYRMPHLVEGLAAIDGWTPHQAHSNVLAAARALNGMADPFALAAVLAAEEKFPQGRRIAGLGGEVARGFYYVGPPFPLPVSPLLTRGLTEWRMFANNAVPESTLTAEFGRWSRQFAASEVLRILRATGERWPQATDHLYLYERMQRWSGVVDSAVCLGRNTVNPMLDPRFVATANALAPRDKASARFLANLVCRLDPELAAIPLEGRLAPTAYANPGLLQRVANQGPLLHKGQRKLVQRVRRDRRPPAGGITLTALVADHWRRHPELLEPVRASGVVSMDWIEGILDGSPLDPSSASFVVNLMAVAP